MAPEERCGALRLRFNSQMCVLTELMLRALEDAMKWGDEERMKRQPMRAPQLEGTFAKTMNLRVSKVCVTRCNGR